MAGWIINTVRIGIEQRRITQKVGSNRFEEKALRKKGLKQQTVDWGGQTKECVMWKSVAKTFTRRGGRHFCGGRYCAETAVYWLFIGSTFKDENCQMVAGWRPSARVYHWSGPNGRGWRKIWGIGAGWSRYPGWPFMGEPMPIDVSSGSQGYIEGWCKESLAHKQARKPRSYASL